MGPIRVPYRHDSASRIQQLERRLAALRMPIVSGVRRECLIWEWTDTEEALNLIAELAKELNLRDP